MPPGGSRRLRGTSGNGKWRITQIGLKEDLNCVTAELNCNLKDKNELFMY